MTGLFTSLRVTASDIPSRLAGALALLLLAAAPAHARAENDPWIELFADEQMQVHVEGPTITRHGGVVYSWVSYTPRKRLRSPANNRKYDYEVHARIDDCTAGTYATEAIIYRRYEGDDVEQAHADALQFERHVPGSLGEYVGAGICRIGAEAPALEAGVGLEDVPATDWRPLGADRTGGVSLSVLAPAAFREGDHAVAVLRGDYAVRKLLPDGRGYNSVVEQALFACEDKTYIVLTSDFYNGSGQLVAVQTNPTETAQVRSVKDDLTALAADAACSAPSAPHTGTGWLAGRGYIVTASHVVGELAEVEVFQDGRRLGAAQVVRNDPANDVAVLKPLFDTSAHAALRINAATPALGERVFTLGYPLADELGVGAVKMTAGDVSSLAGVDVTTGRADDHRYLQVSIPVQSGNSGGPVIAPDGSVVGLIVAKQETSANREIVQNVNFALKSAYINGVIDGLPPVGHARISTARGGTAAVVAGVQSGVFLIVAAPKREQTASR